MTDSHAELLVIANDIGLFIEDIRPNNLLKPTDEIIDSAHEIGKSWSGSALGYHSRVYYSDFAQPPAGAHFSAEWGLQELFSSLGSKGDWKEYSPDYVTEKIYEDANNPNLDEITTKSADAKQKFESLRSDVLSIFSNSLEQSPDTFLSKLKQEVEELEIPSGSDIVNSLVYTGQIMTRDSIALGQGRIAPPHIVVKKDMTLLQLPFEACETLEKIARKAASHLSRKSTKNKKEQLVGTNIFIGHGRSALWKDFKDFIENRLNLPWDEFNRVPVAGVTNIARLSEMLESAAMAFLIMTAEDEQEGGNKRARQNVVHEAGLFQGRLGFTRAIILLEDECEDFSNIDGLGQIRFPKGKIEATYEEVRRVLEREGIIEP